MPSSLVAATFLASVHPKTRKLLAEDRGVALFLVTAMVVAYPTVWIASGARGRYFMPLYPVAAVLIALRAGPNFAALPLELIHAGPGINFY